MSSRLLLNSGSAILISFLSLEEALFCLESEKEAVLDKTEGKKNPFSGK